MSIHAVAQNKDPRDIIIAPVVSEKSYALIDDGKYTFLVDPRANKTEIKLAIEKIFSVEVASINTLNRQGKTRRIVQDQKVGRPGPAGGPGRQQPGNPPGRGQQKGQTQRCRRMRHCQQRRQQPQDQCKQPPALQGSHQTKRDRQRQQRRGHAGSEGKRHGTRQAGPVKQPGHAVRFEGRAQGACQPGHYRCRHQQKGQPGRKAKRPACHHCATP